MAKENVEVVQFKVGDSVAPEDVTEDMKLAIRYQNGMTRHVRTVRGFVPDDRSLMVKCYAWPDNGMPLFETEHEPLPEQGEFEIVYVRDFKTFYTVSDPVIEILYQGMWDETDRKKRGTFPYPVPHI